MTINFNKPLQTRDGQPVTILSTSGRDQYPVVGYIGDDVALYSWTNEGKMYADGSNSYDLQNVPETGVCYVNVFPDGTTCSYSKKEYATADYASERIACIRVEYKIGQFDE